MEQQKQRLEHIRDFVLQTYPRTKIADLPYHNLAHTLDVVKTTEQLAKAEGVDNSELELLLAAAYLHDAGHMFQSEEHEKIGAKYVRPILRGFGYDAKEEKHVSDLIKATKITYVPQSLSEGILRDADIRNIGCSDFWFANEAVRQEIGATQNVNWYLNSLKLMESFAYYTATAKKMYGDKKDKNTEEIRDMIRAL